jgi:hypothetical protein
MLTPEHIRFAKTKQLASLLGVPISAISNWVYLRRQFNEASLDKAVSKGIPKEILVAGFEARRRDLQSVIHLQHEVDIFLSNHD